MYKNLKKELLNASKHAILYSVTQSIQKLHKHLPELFPKKFNKVFVIGWGKAVDPIASELVKIIPKNLLAKVIYLSPKPNFHKGNIIRLQADHPIPSLKNVKSTRKIKEILKASQPSDLIIAISTGGGSAMLDDFLPSIKLKDIIKMNKLLLKHDINCRLINALRGRCSTIKFGRLIQNIPANNIITIVVSDDVLSRGTDRCVAHVASGPTCSTKLDFYSNKRIIHELSKLGIYSKLPFQIKNLLNLENKRTTLKRKSKNLVLADNLDLINNSKEYLELQGFNVKIRKKVLFGEVKPLSKILWIEFLKYLQSYKGSKPLAYIIGGELTVNVKGNGKGGRCQELVAHFIKSLSELNDSVAVAISSDGTDYLKHVAGAIATSETLKRCVKKRINIQKYLETNNTFNLHKRLGNIIPHIYTGTNIGDLVIIAAPSLNKDPKL